jgi:hypothetical protein
MMSARSITFGVFVTGSFILLQAGRATEDAAGKTPRVDFHRHIRPILSDHCFARHGPDQKSRKAKLRLDTREGAFAKLPGGRATIVPGKPNKSELIERVAAHDETEVMPPPQTGKKLTAEQITLLKRWVEEGAAWSSHLVVRSTDEGGPAEGKAVGLAAPCHRSLCPGTPGARKAEAFAGSAAHRPAAPRDA